MTPEEQERLRVIREEAKSEMLYFKPWAMQFVLRLLDERDLHIRGLESQVATLETTKESLVARAVSLTEENDRLRVARVAPAVACGKGLECGGNCIVAQHHQGPCLCAGDDEGKPGTCPA